MSSEMPPPPPPGTPPPGMPPPPGFGSFPQQPPVGGARSGELLERFLARLVDGVILAVANVVVVGTIVVGAVLGETGGTFGFGASYVASAVSSLLGAALYLGYFAFLEGTRGQTVGKMVMKLRVVDERGGPVTMEQAVRRNAWAAIGVLGVVPVLGLLAPLASLAAVIMIAVTINQDTVARRGWHDRFAGGTRVVKA